MENQFLHLSREQARALGHLAEDEGALQLEQHFDFRRTRTWVYFGRGKRKCYRVLKDGRLKEQKD